MNAAIAGFALAGAFALIFAMRTDPEGPIATWAFRVVAVLSALGLIAAVVMR